MEEKLVTYKDLECKLIIENSKKYLIPKKIVNDENESSERLIEKAKEYGFIQAEEGLKLRVYNCFEDYEIDKEYNLCRGESVGKFVLSESETIYAFQMEGCGFTNRFWQITYEEYINYKKWENDKEFIKKLTATRPYLEPYFSRYDLFKIIDEVKIDLINVIEKAIMIAKENIDNNINTNFMNLLIEKYTLAKEQLILIGEINEDITGASKNYLYNYFRVELNEKEELLLKIMDLVDERIEKLTKNKAKYNVQLKKDAQQVGKDDFLNSYYK